jgi:hypothetical protein
MHPGVPGSSQNHKKKYCSDGVKQSMKPDTTPDWPQPPGIFERGVIFNPIPFLKTIHDMYERIVIEGTDGDGLAMEYHAFAKLLQDRTTVAANGTILFKLFDLSLPFDAPTELIIEQNGTRYLRIDCLRD